MTTALATTDSLPAIAQERGCDPAMWNALKNTVFPGAADESVCMALDYCAARKLDPLKKPVHIVQVWDSKSRTMVDQVWPGINELRTTAFRTGEFMGRDKTELGPQITKEFGYGENAVTMAFPEWAQVTVYRLINGEKCAFPGPVVYWEESFASVKGGAPNSMWKRRPVGQLDKCAEAAALRAAFPEEVGGLYSADEMAGQTIESSTGAASSDTIKQMQEGASRPTVTRTSDEAQTSDGGAPEKATTPKKRATKKKAAPKKSEPEVIEGEVTDPPEPEAPEEVEEPEKNEPAKALTADDLEAGKTYDVAVTVIGAQQHPNAKHIAVIKVEGEFDGIILAQMQADHADLKPGTALDVTFEGQKMKSGAIKPVAQSVNRQGADL